MNVAWVPDALDLELQELVSLAISEFQEGAVVSITSAIDFVRSEDMFCMATDLELTKLIVTLATGRTMFVTFDHRHRGAL